MISKRQIERVLDVTALAALFVYVPLTVAGIFTWASTGWTIGLFTGWLLRHGLH